ncbi:hypothetical protein BST61_g2711 [Cercospora zeina]
MDSPARQAEIRAEKLMKDALESLDQALEARSYALATKHAETNQASQEEQTALRRSVDQLREQCEESSKSSTAEIAALTAANAELSTRVTSMEDGLTAMAKMVSDLTEQVSKHDVNRLREQVEAMESNVQTTLLQQNNIRMYMKHQAEGIRCLTVDSAQSRHPVVPNDDFNQPQDAGTKHPFPHALAAGIERSPQQITRRMPDVDHAAVDVDQLAGQRSPSSATFRGPSSDSDDGRHAFGDSRKSTSSSAKRTAYQRHSASFEEALSIPHKRSGSLQRKPAERNLRKASAECFAASAIPPLKPSALQNIFAAVDADKKDYAMSSDASSEIVVARSRPAPISLTSELSPASKEITQKIAEGQSALDSLKSVGATLSPNKQSLSWPQQPVVSLSPAAQARNGIAAQAPQHTGQRLEPMLGAADSTLPGLLDGSKPLIATARSPVQQSRVLPSTQSTQVLPAPPAGQRRSSRERKKKGLPDNFVDLSTYVNDKRLGLVPKREGHERLS